MKRENKKLLNELYIQHQKKKHPSVPEHCLAQKYAHSDNSTNGLTKCIIDFLNYSGHYAERINTTGKYVDNSKVVENVLGQKVKVGSGQWIKGTGVKGRADITAKIKMENTPYPVAVEIEIKFGKDRMSDAQKEYQSKMEDIGTPYVVIKTFDNFIEWFNLFTKKL